MDKIKLMENEIVDQLKEANKNCKGDNEILHMEMDEILLEFLQSIGCNKIVEVYKSSSNNFHYS